MKHSIYIAIGATILSIMPLVDAKTAIDKKGQGNGGQKFYTELKSMDEYESAKKTSPTIIVCNSPSCSACDFMEPALNGVAKEYSQAKFYTVNLKDPAFKGLQKKLDIKGIPTTYFYAEGKDPRIEKGSLGADEFEEITYETIHGKKMKRKPPVEIKKSLEEKKK